jgi:hypothetical protein
MNLAMARRIPDPSCLSCGTRLTEHNWPIFRRANSVRRCTDCHPVRAVHLLDPAHAKRLIEAARQRTRLKTAQHQLLQKCELFERIGTGQSECYRCQVTDLRILELDHLDGGGSKEHRAARKRGGDINPYVRTLRLIGTGERSRWDYQVLCRPCNALAYLERKFPDLKGLGRISWADAIETRPLPVRDIRPPTPSAPVLVAGLEDSE